MKNNTVKTVHAINYKQGCKPISIADYKQNYKTMFRNKYDLNITCFKKVKISKVKNSNNRYLFLAIAEVE